MFDLIYTAHLSDKSFIGKIDPRAKILLFISYISVVIYIDVNTVFPLIFLGIGLLCMIVFSQFPGTKIVRALVKIYPMIFLISIFQLLSMQSGDYLHSGFGFVDLSSDSLMQLLGFQVKSILIISSGLVMISSTPMKLFLKSFEKLGMPNWILTVAFFIYHFVYILSHELSRLNLAYQSRYIKLTLVRKLVIHSKLMAMLFLRIFERNDRLYNSLMSRGFNGSISFDTSLSWKFTDSILILSGFAFLSLILFVV